MYDDDDDDDDDDGEMSDACILATLQPRRAVPVKSAGQYLSWAFPHDVDRSATWRHLPYDLRLAKLASVARADLRLLGRKP